MQAALQGIVSPLFLIGIALLLASGLDHRGNFVALVSYLAASLSSLALLVIAARLISPQVPRALHNVPRLRSKRGMKVVGTAAPMLVQSIATPIALQSDRLLLSHGASSTALAQYTFASQIFGLVMQAIIAAGIALWPFFARARARGEVLGIRRLTAGFLIAALAACGTLATVMPYIEDVAADGKVRLPTELIVGYVVLVAVQALNYPPGMYMTDERGLKFQVVPIVVMMISNVALSWALIPYFGAAGPVFGSSIAILVFQVIPNTWWVQRDVRRRRP